MVLLDGTRTTTTEGGLNRSELDAAKENGDDSSPVELGVADGGRNVEGAKEMAFLNTVWIEADTTLLSREVGCVGTTDMVPGMMLARGARTTLQLQTSMTLKKEGGTKATAEVLRTRGEGRVKGE